MSTRPRIPATAHPRPASSPITELAEMKESGDTDRRWSPPTTPPARASPRTPGVDMILVGDTAAMMVLGHEGTTVPVTMDEMLVPHARGGARRASGRSSSATCRSARSRSPTSRR